jgi:hypothetical protein
MPNQWIADNGLGKGSEVTVSSDNSCLIVNRNEIPKGKRATIAIGIATPKVLTTFITGLFTAGFDEFELKFEKKLTKDAYNKLKELIFNFGLNMIELTDDSVKLNVNISITDIKTFTRDYLYKLLNYTRMVLTKTDDEIVEEQLRSIYYNRYIMLRSIYRFQKGLSSSDLKNYESNFYYDLAMNLNRLAINIRRVNDSAYLEKVKNILEKFLLVYKSPEINSLKNLLSLVEEIEVEDWSKNYGKRRVYRCLKDMIRCAVEVYFAKI